MPREVVKIKDQDELVQLRREGGAWLRSLREAAGLTQRELANAVGADYYTFISQLEMGRGRVPPGFTKAWAKAVKVPPRELVLGMMKYYEPIWYECLGEETKEPPRVAPKARSDDEVRKLEERLNRLEQLLERQGR